MLWSLLVCSAQVVKAPQMKQLMESDPALAHQVIVAIVGA